MTEEKKKFLVPEADIVKFANGDIITVSVGNGEIPEDGFQDGPHDEWYM